MIKKLRTKFIILSTISLLLLLAIMVISSNLLTYRELVLEADIVLSAISQRGGAKDDMRMLPPKPEGNPENSSKAPFGEKPESIDTDKLHMKHKRIVGDRFLSPEIMYEARFFTADISAVGEINSINTENIAMIDDEEALKYVQSALNKKGDKGFIKEFRFLKTQQENDTYVIFLDCGRKLDTFKGSFIINSLISFIGFLVICALVIVFSKIIVKPASESYEKQKQFISMAGHELKTPVTIIGADAEVLSMEFEEENEWLNDICNQTKRMATLTNDLLSLSRMDENREQFTMIDFPISDVVSETAQSFQALLLSKNRSIKTQITPMLSYNGDEKSIRQITGILIDNAIKYSIEDENGVCPDIELKLEQRNHNIILSVKNSAEPITEEQLKQFFDRFYRTEQSRNSEKGGFGLGLSIAKSLVEAHKGKITATAPDKASIQITVVFPIRNHWKNTKIP